MYEQKEGGIILASIRTSFVVVLKEIGEGASGGATSPAPNLFVDSQKVSHTKWRTIFIRPSTLQIWILREL